MEKETRNQELGTGNKEQGIRYYRNNEQGTYQELETGNKEQLNKILQKQ